MRAILDVDGNPIPSAARRLSELAALVDRSTGHLCGAAKAKKFRTWRVGKRMVYALPPEVKEWARSSRRLRPPDGFGLKGAEVSPEVSAAARVLHRARAEKRFVTDHPPEQTELKFPMVQGPETLPAAQYAEVVARLKIMGLQIERMADTAAECLIRLDRIAQAWGC